MKEGVLFVCLSLMLVGALLTGCATPAPTTPQAAATPQTTTAEATATAVTAAETTPPEVTSASTQATPGDDPLRFPVDIYTTETITVTTSSGIVEVTYRLYSAIPYVTNPVDADYESMNVKVPVTIDGKDVDASHAPILLANSVGGYMSSSVNGGMGGMPPAGMKGKPPAGMGTPSGANNNGVSRNTDLALAAGYVVVQPGVRGRDNQAEDGTYYGKAPAAIVDLKAAVRYLRYNQGVMPGNTDWIISTGVSAGGALSALLGASGNSELYESDLQALGAAEADDTIFASADFCPITDLEHADMAYEWQMGGQPANGQTVDQALSEELAQGFAEYLATLNLQGANGYGTLTADNYGDYLVQTVLVPSASKYLAALSNEDRAAYLADNPWLTWQDDTASFTWADYVAHAGRKKSLPAFDAFDLSAAENILFGNATTDARHFTNWSLQQASGDANAKIEADVQTAVNLMNPMYYIGQGCTGCAAHWWIRLGSSDVDTSLAISADLATTLQNQGKDVNYALYWDAGHGADADPEAFIAWIGTITGYTAK